MAETVLDWLERLRRIQPEVPHLSPEGARLALDAALDALNGIERHFDIPAPEHTVFIAARTVFTAPLEWIAVLLGRGGRVTLKSPEPLFPWFEQVAQTDLPLRITSDRDLPTADRIIAMGSDTTIEALRIQYGNTLLGFGSRYSVAWWSDPHRADALARDLVLHDGRGCMCPVAIFSPLDDATDLLHAALDRWSPTPRGPLGAAEAALIRSRTALARVLGTAQTGTNHTVVQLPLTHLQLNGLPRVAVVHSCPDPNTMFHTLTDPRISVIGTDTPLNTPHRTSSLGQMQQPPLDRLHDGIDWLKAL